MCVTLFTIKQELPAAGLRMLHRDGPGRSAHVPCLLVIRVSTLLWSFLWYRSNTREDHLGAITFAVALGTAHQHGNTHMVHMA